MELTPEERRRIYEEEKVKMEREQPPHLPSPTTLESSPSFSHQLGWLYRQICNYPMVSAFLAVILFFGVLVLLLIAFTDQKKISNNTDSNNNTELSGNYNYQFYKPTPQPSTASNLTSQPSKTSNFPPSNFPSTSPSSTTTTSPPVNSEDDLRQTMLSAAENRITYEQLKKNADRYNGQAWMFGGKVLQIQESGGQTFALISLDAWGGKTMAVRAGFGTEFVEKDQVTVIGYLAGDYSYESVAGWNLTVPLLDARAILKPAEAARLKGDKKNFKQ